MTATHAIFIGLNLVLAVSIYVAALRSRRLDPLALAIIGGFCSIAMLEIWLTLTDASTASSFAVVLMLDAILVGFAATYLFRERAARREAERERDSVQDALVAEREARALALRDRCGNAF